MFREPEASNGNDAAAKVEATAAASRSPIRRRTIIIEDGRRSQESRRRQREHSENRRSPPSDNRYSWERNFESRAHNIERSLQDAIGRARSNRDSLRAGRRLDQPRESALRFEVAPGGLISSRGREEYDQERSTTREFFMPSPPYSSSGRRSGVSPEYPRRSPSVTPGFAPAHPQPNSQSNRNGRGLDFVTLPGIRFALGDAWADNLPPLVRMSDRAPTPPTFTRTSPPPDMDGLGDRRRSVSLGLSDSSSGNDAWDTLLTTMEPDEHLPSTSSSFTSAEASASAARSTTASARSSQTTAPTHLGSFDDRDDVEFSTSALHPCDPESSDSDSIPNLISVDGFARRRSSAQPPMARRIASPHQRIRRTGSRRPETFTEFDRYSSSSDSDDRLQRRARLHEQRMRRDQLRRAGRPLREDPGHRLDDRNSVDDLQNSWRRDSATGRRRELGGEASTGNRVSNLEIHMQDFQRRNEDRERELMELERRNAETEIDLANMQRLIERLARRDDIPNEWWAAAGLARTVRESQV